MRKPFGLIRLPALPAPSVRHARTAMTLYAVGPRSTATVRLDAAGLKRGDVAGLVLFNGACAWLGVERAGHGLVLARSHEPSGRTDRLPLEGRRVWLRAQCDFVGNTAGFHYSIDGRSYAPIGEAYALDRDPAAFLVVACSLFSRATTAAAGGHADFDSFVLATERTASQD